MKKIVCHGDSLTEAADLEKGYVWTALVENRLNLEIINSGIGGDTRPVAGSQGADPDIHSTGPDRGRSS